MLSSSDDFSRASYLVPWYYNVYNEISTQGVLKGGFKGGMNVKNFGVCVYGE
jgi:hypothetical protein